MNFDEESEEYLDDPILLIDFERSKCDEEFEIKDLITIEDEGVIDISCQFIQKSFDEYIQSFVKDVSILPYSFRSIKENIKLIDACRPLSIQVIDCNALPKRGSDMFKIFYNKELEKYIQCRKNDGITGDKFKEIMTNHYVDVDKITNCKDNTDVESFEMDDIIYVDDIKESNEILEQCEQVNCTFHSEADRFILSKETDDVICVHNIRNDVFNGLHTCQTKAKDNYLDKILKPCAKINCISLSTETESTLSNPNKIVPHFHKRADRQKIKFVNEQESHRSQVEQNGANAKYEINNKNKHNNTSKLKNINTLEVDIINGNHRPIVDTQIQGAHRLQDKPDIYNHAYIVSNNANKTTKFHNNPLCDKIITENDKLTLTESARNINKIMVKSPKSKNVDVKMKKKNRKIDMNVNELQNKYFSNSTSNLVSLKTSSTDLYSQTFDMYPTQITNSSVSPKNVMSNTENLHVPVHGGDKHNIFHLGNHDCVHNNRMRYTPYPIPMEDKLNSNGTHISRKLPVFALPQSKNNSPKRNDPLHITKCVICRIPNYKSNEENVVSVNPVSSFNFSQPYSYTVSSNQINEMSSNKYKEMCPVNNFNLSDDINHRGYKNINNPESSLNYNHSYLYTSILNNEVLNKIPFETVPINNHELPENVHQQGLINNTIQENIQENGTPLTNNILARNIYKHGNQTSNKNKAEVKQKGKAYEFNNNISVGNYYKPVTIVSNNGIANVKQILPSKNASPLKSNGMSKKTTVPQYRKQMLVNKKGQGISIVSKIMDKVQKQRPLMQNNNLKSQYEMKRSEKIQKEITLETKNDDESPKILFNNLDVGVGVEKKGYPVLKSFLTPNLNKANRSVTSASSSGRIRPLLDIDHFQSVTYNTVPMRPNLIEINPIVTKLNEAVEPLIQNTSKTRHNLKEINPILNNSNGVNKSDIYNIVNMRLNLKEINSTLSDSNEANESDIYNIANMRPNLKEINPILTNSDKANELDTYNTANKRLTNSNEANKSEIYNTAYVTSNLKEMNYTQTRSNVVNETDTCNTANIRLNLKEIKGYSPPILPIPTYQKTFEILAQVNLTSKYKINSQRSDIDKATYDLYNQEKILSNRRITHDMQQYTASSSFRLSKYKSRPT